MTHRQNGSIDDPTMIAALHWLAEMQDADTPPNRRSAFLTWLNSDPAHQDAWARAQETWDYSARIEPVLRRARRPKAVPQYGRRLAALAAGLAVLALGSLITMRPDLMADHRTGAGERRDVTLADGSQVTMNADTALSVTLDGNRRHITLYRGEAFFQVAPDSARPFDVTAGKGTTRALGTAFDVNDTGETVTVTVTEHAVAITAGGYAPVTVSQGMRLRYGPQGPSAAQPANTGAALAWKRGRLVFQEAPLHDVLAELDRQRGGIIVITDPKIAAMPVTAVFDSGRSEDALDTIAATLPVRLTRLGRVVTLIRPLE